MKHKLKEDNTKELVDLYKQLIQLKRDILFTKRKVLNDECLGRRNVLGFLYYKKRKYTKDGVFGKHFDGYEDCVRLVYLTSWSILEPSFEEAFPHFSSVSANGNIGNCIDVTFLEDIEFEEANCSVEEAKKILKEAKKKCSAKGGVQYD